MYLIKLLTPFSFISKRNVDNGNLKHNTFEIYWYFAQKIVSRGLWGVLSSFFEMRVSQSKIHSIIFMQWECDKYLLEQPRECWKLCENKYFHFNPIQTCTHKLTHINPIISITSKLCKWGVAFQSAAVVSAHLGSNPEHPPPRVNKMNSMDLILWTALWPLFN